MVMLEKRQEIYELMPELAALDGVPQPPRWHPEGTVDEHVRQVTDIAATFGRPDITFGALMHDLGKGVTNKNNWPHHYSHEALGVPLVRTLGERLEVGNDLIEFGILCAKEHLNIHRFFELRPVKKVDLIIRIAPHISGVVAVAEADARGRGPDYWTKPYPQAAAVVQAWEIIIEMHDKDFVGRTLSEQVPNKLQKIRMARAKAIAGKFGA